MSEEYAPMDFVFCGLRSSRDRLVMAIAPITSGEVEETIFFAHKGKLRYVIGGVYSGAEFSASGAKGLDSASFVRSWSDRGEVIRWQALSDQAEAQARTKKLEANARKVNEIEAVLLPLRKQYAVFQRQRDRAGASALEQAVMAALRAPVRQGE
jgi:hypothetical protein